MSGVRTEKRAVLPEAAAVAAAAAGKIGQYPDPLDYVSLSSRCWYVVYDRPGLVVQSNKLQKPRTKARKQAHYFNPRQTNKKSTSIAILFIDRHQCHRIHHETQKIRHAALAPLTDTPNPHHRPLLN